MSQVQESVRERYSEAAKRLSAGGCCDGNCCHDSSSDCCGSAYSTAELADLGLDSSLSLGCGNPLLLAELRPGQMVLDLGSGGGIDVLLSARRVAPGGLAYGVDMTDEMLRVADRNRRRAGIENATFLKGTIEQVPLPDMSIDVVISNCVINLAEDKGRVLKEAFRVLKPGGRLAVADMVELHRLPAVVKKAMEAWAGCIAGTIPAADYQNLVAAAGFQNVDIEVVQEHGINGGRGAIGSAYIRARKPDAMESTP